MTGREIEPGTSPPGTPFRRLFALAARLTATIVVLGMLPVLVESAWIAIRLHFPMGLETVLRDVKFYLFGLAALAVLCWRPRYLVLWTLPERSWHEVDRFGAWLSRRGGVIALAGLSTYWFATWMPHYLGWPFWSDTDHFALSALSWDRGIVPYRDLIDFNFPGPFYLHGLIGNTLGWGRTVPVYAVDAAMVAGLAWILTWWSGRRFGDALPGWVAFVMFAGYYFQQGYATVAQRDWQVTWLCVAGLALLEVGRDRASWWGAAVLYGSAMGFRPHAVLFGPAFLLALVQRSRRDGGDRIGTVARDVAAWGALAGFTLAMYFAPIAYEGAFDDFLRNFESAWYGGEKNQGARLSLPWRVAGELSDGRTILKLVTIAILAAWPGARFGATARLWGLALLGAGLFRPLSPIAHGYLAQPRILLESIAVGVVLGALREIRFFEGRRAAWFVLLTTAVIFDRTPLRPSMCLAGHSVEQVGAFLRGEPIARSPAGCGAIIPSSLNEESINWNGYVSTLDHLRRTTDGRTRVANLIEVFPFPSVNGPTGRLSPLPCGEGIQWLLWVDRGLEPMFVDALIRRRERPTVVVWAPGRMNQGLVRLQRAVREHFAFEAKYYGFEIWRQKPDPAGPGAQGNGPRATAVAAPVGRSGDVSAH